MRQTEPNRQRTKIEDKQVVYGIAASFAIFFVFVLLILTGFLR